MWFRGTPLKALLGRYLQGWMAQVPRELSGCRAASAKVAGGRPVGSKIPSEFKIQGLAL